MTLFRRLLAPLLVGLAATLATVSSAWAAPFQLGFALDGSGSVSTSNYNLLRSGLSNAMAAIPADGTIEITVVTYGSSVSTVVSPTILTAASLQGIQVNIVNHTKAGGGTNTAAAIDSLTALMTGSSVFQEPDVTSIINLATDGFPNSQSAAEASAQAAAAAGIDALSIEAIGSGVASQSALSNLSQIAFPDPVSILGVNTTNIPNPLNGSFVVPISDFNSLEPVILAKVIASVTPNPDPTRVPVPGTLPLFLIGTLIAALRSGRMTVRAAV
ncbi:VWA domain-containing protein [Haliea sp. E1-2-M8]|uniref:VWA domain-containing protein n=1 Tax=Haliea sp. E1-2-M8 TaxID=3064706 RepID=UPI002724A1FF|nr:vWA domain-containing protein [Haliea sp. E1-2-M8]MDO8860490.1 VWA domain-containing protein [Haliea sp. E1-2-M8]